MIGMVLSSLLVLSLFFPLRYVYDNGIDGINDCCLRSLMSLIAGTASGVTLSLYASPHLTWFMKPVTVFLLRTRLPTIGFWLLLAGVVFTCVSLVSDSPLYTGFVSLLALVTGYTAGSLLLFAITSSIIMIILYFCLRWLLPLLLGILGGLGGAFDDLENEPSSMESTEVSVNQSRTETEVWRMNGMMRQNLRVSSDQESYYDPDDGEWHLIKK